MNVNKSLLGGKVNYMKKSFRLFALVFVVYFVGNTVIKSIANAAIEKEVVSIETENTLLWDYYYSTEQLLDTLEMRYQWVDAIDPYSYYEAVEALYENNIK